jgi:hypothetical protein
VELLHPITKHMDTAATAVLQASHRYSIDWLPDQIYISLNKFWKLDLNCCSHSKNSDL